ncbi:MAG: ATP-binding protein [Bacteroidetes bacterium]|nr:ATP-binding protein [Bacteroidota bacterium]
MERQIDNALSEWKLNLSRKVLLLRGARQVGKTWSVRNLGKRFRYFLEINFESAREIHRFFTGNLYPEEICRNLSAYYNVPLTDGETLLFFDEIQACTPAISSLRFFYEKRPGLHLIAAGSLLEFALEQLPSYGLGRIEHLFMYPMSFDEYLLAGGQKTLLDMKAESSPEKPLNPAIHTRLITLLKEFLFIGGMPEAVKTYIQSTDLRKTSHVLDQFLNGLIGDFAKYKSRVPLPRLREVFDAVVFQSGCKFNLSKASPSSNYFQIKEAINLLEMAGLIYKVHHTSADGIPLGAQVNLSKFKIVMFDHGIYQRIMGLDLSEYLLADSFSAINKGNIAEQFVGTEMIKYQNPESRHNLLYWHRETRGSNAEVDYLFQKGLSIVPVEVKSGMQGKMQSLQVFLKEKGISSGIRVSMENFGKYGNFQIYPLYAIHELINLNNFH